MLTFEYGRYVKITIALFANDQTAYFDRMIPSFTNIIAQANGATATELLCRSKTIAKMKRHIKTGLGVSKQAYKNQLGHPQIQGEIQGKGDVASLWTMTSSILLFAHAILYAEIVISQSWLDSASSCKTSSSGWARVD